MKKSQFLFFFGPSCDLVFISKPIPTKYIIKGPWKGENYCVNGCGMVCDWDVGCYRNSRCEKGRKWWKSPEFQVNRIDFVDSNFFMGVRIIFEL